MAKIKLKHYVVRKGRGFWLPTRKMQAFGFASVPCGVDGPAAWQVAKTWEDRWQAARKGEAPTLRKIYPKGSVGFGFEQYRLSSVWKGKKPRTREDWDRGWKYIEPYFGDVSPATISFQHLDRWYFSIIEKKGINEAYRAMKIWRALYVVLSGMKLCPPNADPSLNIRRQTPKPRHQTFAFDEVRRLVKTAWRAGYRGLACIIAVAWDTGFSPVDARTLTPSNQHDTATGWEYRINRLKTGVSAIGTLSYKTRQIVTGYLADLGADPLNDAPLFRNRSGAAYSKDTLGDDFRAVRALAFGTGDQRRLMDLRRSGAVEALVGGATAEGIGSKLGNSIGSNKTLQKTYLPTEAAAVRQVDIHRQIGRQRLAANKPATKS